MIKMKIIGLAILLIGIIIKFVIENELLDFISGILIGAGIALFFIGQIRAKKMNELE